jgi:hypothetical protein
MGQEACEERIDGSNKVIAVRFKRADARPDRVSFDGGESPVHGELLHQNKRLRSDQRPFRRISSFEA